MFENKAELSSNNGLDLTVFSFKKKFSIDNNTIILSEISLESSFWERDIAISDAKKTRDCEVKICQVLLSEEKLKQFIHFLEDWLNNYNCIDIELSGNKTEQDLSIFIGPSEDLISKADHPVFSLQYCSAKINIGWRFVTDPSCIAILLEGLKEELNKISN